MIYQTQELLINGLWDTVSYTTCFKSALGQLEPRQRVIDMISREVIVQKIGNKLNAFPNHLKLINT